MAWKHLLQNHPHDSICGCSIDQVHKDMEYRFAQCEALGTQVLGDALEHIVGRIALPPIDGQEFAVTVFNPTADAIDGPVDLTLRFPEGIDATFQEFFGFEPKVAFDLLDADGKALPYQYVAQRRDVIGFRRRLRKFPAPDRRHEVDVTAPLEVPAYGYSTLLVRPVKGRPTRFMGSMLVDDHTIENERLRVSVATNGTVSLTDKRGKQTYEGLLTLEDCADIGDGWYHGPAVNDQVYTSTAAQAEVAVIADGPHKATLMVRLTLNLPEQFCFHQMRRSDRRAPLVVTHELTLRQGSDRLEVRTVVENTIRDHRLRVLLPTARAGLTTGCMLAVARAAGETAPLMFTALGNQFWQSRLDQPIASLPVQIYRYAIGPYADWHDQAWTGALILILLVLVTSILARVAGRGART